MTRHSITRGALLVAVLAAASPTRGDAQPAEGDGGAIAAVARAEARIVAVVRQDVLTNLEAQRVAAASLARQAGEVAALLRAKAAEGASAEDAETTARLLLAAQGTLTDTARQLERLFADLRLLVAQHDLASRRSSDLARAAAAEAARRPGALEPLTGEWDVAMGPMNDRGTFRLRQTGTLVTGDYELSSGRRGSLQGTFVGNRLDLEPIDSRFGRDTALHGTVAGSFTAIEGSWEARVFGAGRPAGGKWSASKREAPIPQGGAGAEEAPEP